MSSLLLAIQKMIIRYKGLIIWVFHLMWMFIIGVGLAGVIWAVQNPDRAFKLYSIGRSFGQVAIFFYIVGLFPGIMKRLDILRPLQVSMMLFRRHFGVTMWWAALVHMLFTITLRVFLSGLPLPQQLKYIVASIALTITFILWTTSNATAQKLLGKRWRWLHRTTYVILFLLFLHVALVQTRWMYVTLGVMILELLSWIAITFRQRRAETAAPSTTQATNTPERGV